MMKRQSRTAIAATALLLPALGWGELMLRPTGSLRLEGDSTLHTFASTATQVTLSFQLSDSAKGLPEAIQGAQVKSMEVKIPVEGLKSGENGLDKNLRAALKAGQFKDILYKLGKYELVKGEAGAPMTAKTSGELTIAGQTQPVSMDVEFRFGPDAVEVRGSHALLMSEYGIKPPSLMLGAIKVKDKVTVRFDLWLKQDEPKPQTN